MHLPKTAGTSLHIALAQAFSSRGAFYGFDAELLDLNPSTEEGYGPQIILGSAGIPDVSYLGGHISLSAARERFPDAQVATFLREPVIRTLSHYAYWRGLPVNQIVDQKAKTIVEKAQEPLGVFLKDQNIAYQIDNIATRFLLWPNAKIEQHEFIKPEYSEELLLAAEQKIDSFAFSAVIEDRYWMERFETWLGCSLVRAQVNSTPPLEVGLRISLSRLLTASTVDSLERLNRLDLALWRRIAEKFQSSRETDRMLCNARVKGIARFAELLAGSDIKD